MLRRRTPIFVLALALTACGKDPPRADPAATSAAATPTAATPAGAATAASAAVSALAAVPAPAATTAAVNDPLAEAPIVEGAPTANQWASASEVVVRGSSALGCETKQIGDWFRMVC